MAGDVPRSEGGEFGEDFVAPDVVHSQPPLDLQAIAAKIEHAKAIQEQHIDQKVTKRKQLIGEAKTNAEQLHEAESLLAYYQEQQDAGLLEGKAAVGFSELQQLVETLRSNSATINQGIDTISGDEKVISRLQDEAKDIDSEKERAQLIEHWEKEFGSEAEGLATYITDSVERYEQNLSQDAEKNAARESTMRDLQEQYRSIRQRLNQKFTQFLAENISNFETQQVEGAIGKIGLFDGSSRQSLENLRQLHENWLLQYQSHSDSATSVGMEQKEFERSFQKFLEHIGTRVNELGGDETVAQAIRNRARKRIENSLTEVSKKPLRTYSIQALEWYKSKVRYG